MRKLILTMGAAAGAIGVAALTVAFQGVGVADERFGPPHEGTQADRALPNLSEGIMGKRELGSPYEEYQLDRALPQFPEQATGSRKARGAPYEETMADRSLPMVSGGGDEGASAGASMSAGEAWDKDYNFVVPAP